MKLPKHLLAAFLVASLLGWLPPTGTLAQLPEVTSSPAHPTRLLAKYKDGVQPQNKAALLASQGLALQREHPFVRGLVSLDLADPAQAKVLAAAPPAEQRRQLAGRMQALGRSGIFEYVEPDYQVTVNALPNDAKVLDGTLWGLRNTGTNGGIAGVDIGAERAWDLTTGSTNVIVGVIDTGIRYTHQELRTQMWRNPGEIPRDRIDNDHNGIVDDVFGFNLLDRTGDPMDDHGHGTHVSGTIGAAANDGYPIVGVAWQVRLAIFLPHFSASSSSSWGGGSTTSPSRELRRRCEQVYFRHRS